MKIFNTYHRQTLAMNSRAEAIYFHMENKTGQPNDFDSKRTDKRKQSLYFPEDMLKEIQLEANRQDRSLSWIVQQAWRLARAEIMRFPSVNDVVGEDRED